MSIFITDNNNQIYIATDITFILIVCLISFHTFLITALVHALRKEREEHDRLYRKYQFHKFVVDEINKNK